MLAFELGSGSFLYIFLSHTLYTLQENAIFENVGVEIRLTVEYMVKYETMKKKSLVIYVSNCTQICQEILQQAELIL